MARWKEKWKRKLGFLFCIFATNMLCVTKIVMCFSGLGLLLSEWKEKCLQSLLASSEGKMECWHRNTNLESFQHTCTISTTKRHMLPYQTHTSKLTANMRALLFPGHLTHTCTHPPNHTSPQMHADLSAYYMLDLPLQVPTKVSENNHGPVKRCQ